MKEMIIDMEQITRDNGRKQGKKLKPENTVCIHYQDMDQPTSTGPKSGLNKELEGT
jgi:hypothetical protein